MATVTLAAVSGGNYVVGNKKVKTYDVTLTASYASGDDLAPADVGLKVILECRPSLFRKSDDSDAIVVSYKHSTSKLIAYRQKDPANAGGADIAFPKVGTVDLSGYSGRVAFIGN